MKLSFNLKLSQSLRLTPLLQQSIKLLQASQSELNQLIEDYLNDNIFLELEERAETNSVGQTNFDSSKETSFKNDYSYELFDTEIKNINSWNLTYRQKAQIIYPTNIKELQSIIKFCKKKAKTITIRTGKCSYDSKSIPANENCIIISLRKFNKITQINKKKYKIQKKIVKTNLKNRFKK